MYLGNTTVSGTLNAVGTATGPTPTTGDNSTKLATTAFVATALPSVPTTTPLTGTGSAGGAQAATGTLVLPNGTTATTQAAADNSTKTATTAYVYNALTGAAAISTTGGSTTLTATQYGLPILVVTGALTSAATLVVPNNGEWEVINRTTGAYSLTVSTSGGTGTVVPQNQSRTLVADGTNVVPINYAAGNEGAIRINAVGNSIFGAQSGYQPAGAYATTPAWATSTSISTVGQCVQNNSLTYRCTATGTTASSGSGPGTSVGETGSLVGGTSYSASGNFTGVTLTGSVSGSTSALGTVVTNGSGVITSITVTTFGSGYQVGEQLQPLTSTGGMGSVGSGGSVLVKTIGTGTAIVDGTVTWTVLAPRVYVYNSSVLHWLEVFTLGRVRFNMEEGYAGVTAGAFRAIVTAGGSSYANTDTWTSTNGVAGTITESGGVITGATVTNPGNLSNAMANATITTSTGSGATIRVCVNPSGTFAVSGALTSDMVYFAQDAAASKTDIVICGYMATNDVTNNVTSVATCESTYASVIANLKTIYNTLLNAGKKIVICPDLPRYGNTTIQNACLNAIANWQRKFAASYPTYNSTNISKVVIADVTPYFADGTIANLGQPIGGNGAGNAAMTLDGLHPSARGAQYMAQAIMTAAARWIGSGETISAREANAAGGFDRTMNPDGNMIEAFPWQASTAYAVGQCCSNNSNIYHCSQAGTTASSGGPSGTGSGITDNGAKWGYDRPQGCSVLAGTSTALSAAPTGITYSGNYPLGWVLTRINGSASGTVTGTIESPWSNGQVGQRWELAFSLGSGTDREEWQAYINNFGLSTFGIEVADEGTAQVYALCELEVSGQANLSIVRLYWGDSSINNAGTDVGYSSTSTSGTHLTEAAGSGEMITMPTRRLLRTPPLTVTQVHGGNTSFQLYFQFDASGSSASATATIKINFVGLYRADVS